ncbi:MAG: hypothetical protein ACRDRG_13390 [Pseudonocardiaceae bacterium]
MTDLAKLPAGPTARQALACRDITAVFRVLRDAGVSQVAIARATGRETEGERRRNLFRHAATLLHGTPVFGPPRPIPVTEAPTPVPRRVGPPTSSGSRSPPSGWTSSPGTLAVSR